LAVDLNGNGRIDVGAEIFAVPVSGPIRGRKPTPLENSFTLLAAYDAPERGGNGDGAITAADGVFAQLRVWVDANHDGVSQPEELQSLSAAGITAIGLTYQTVGRKDGRGNYYRYRGVVTRTGGETLPLWDVFLALTVSATGPQSAAWASTAPATTTAVSVNDVVARAVGETAVVAGGFSREHRSVGGLVVHGFTSLAGWVRDAVADGSRVVASAVATPVRAARRGGGSPPPGMRAAIGNAAEPSAGRAAAAARPAHVAERGVRYPAGVREQPAWPETTANAPTAVDTIVLDSLADADASVADSSLAGAASLDFTPGAPLDLTPPPAPPPPPPTTLQVVEYYHLDVLGSVRVVTDQAGAVIARHDFLPFGEEVSQDPLAKERKLFTGQERDFETGLDYFQARMLRPDLGRFLTVDPLSEIRGRS
jgi:RHS repeat-associated protein